MSKRIVICSHIDGNGEKYTYIVPDYMDIKKGDILIAENKKYGGYSTVIARSSVHTLEKEIIDIMTDGHRVRSHIIDKLIPESTPKTGDECSSSEKPNYSKDVERIKEICEEIAKHIEQTQKRWI